MLIRHEQPIVADGDGRWIGLVKIFPQIFASRSVKYFDAARTGDHKLVANCMDVDAVGIPALSKATWTPHPEEHATSQIVNVARSGVHRHVTQTYHIAVADFSQQCFRSSAIDAY